MSAEMAPVLALDLGGTTVKAGVVSADGTVLAQVARRSAEHLGIEAWVAAGLAAATEALERCDTRPARVGLSVPGGVDPVACRLVDLVDRLPSDGIDLAAAFAPLGLFVTAENDAKAALAAELRWGGVDPTEDVVVLTLGTGIGSAASIGGRAPGGERVLAGNQLGHLTVELDGAKCVCGNRGCAETVAAPGALVAAARAAGLEVRDASDVFAAEAGGDHRAVALVARFLDGLVAAVINAIHAYQPSIVVLTGGLMASAERVVPPLRAAVDERAWTIPRGRVRLEASRLGSVAGVLAGAAVAFDSEDAQ